MNTQQDHIVQEQPVETAVRRRRFTVGFPASTEAGELRFPITPEGVEQLTRSGLGVFVEKEAGHPIHYSDARYAEAGAITGSRAEALSADIVVSLAQLSLADTQLLRKGSMLLTLNSRRKLTPEFVKSLLKHHVTCIELEKISLAGGKHPFADVLLEVDGRAAMALASATLLRNDLGKGILLGGVPGVISCEVMIVGSDIGARAAAAAAVAMGAQVKMFDNDVYGLRQAVASVGAAVATSVVQPHVLENALRSADVIIASPAVGFDEFTSRQMSLAKKGVVLVDIGPVCKTMFPTEEQIFIGSGLPTIKPGCRACFRAVGNAAPRTAAMALTNTLVESLGRLGQLDGALSLLPADEGLRPAVCTFMGKAINADYARVAGVRPIDLNLLLSCS